MSRIYVPFNFNRIHSWSVRIIKRVDGDQRFWNPGLAKDIASKYIDILNEFRSFSPILDEDWERFDVEDALIAGWNASKGELDKRIDQAWHLQKSNPGGHRIRK